MKLKLIDEYKLTLHPVILGNGISLFDSNITTSALKLLESKALGSGVDTVAFMRTGREAGPRRGTTGGSARDESGSIRADFRWRKN